MQANYAYLQQLIPTLVFNKTKIKVKISEYEEKNNKEKEA